MPPPPQPLSALTRPDAIRDVVQLTPPLPPACCLGLEAQPWHAAQQLWQSWS